MAEATNDLPSPLDSNAAASRNADDLVAQLAEKAIDQMLSEKEIERPEQTIEATADNLQSQLDSLLSDVTAALPNPPADPAPAGSAAVAPAVVASAPVASVPVASTESTSAHVVTSHGAPLPMEDATHVAASATPANRLNQTEVDDLVATYQPPAESSLPSASDVQTLLHDIEPHESRGGQLLITGLEWINRPFDFIPPAVRERLGQIAILTLINALVILGYVIYHRWK